MVLLFYMMELFRLLQTGELSKILADSTTYSTHQPELYRHVSKNYYSDTRHKAGYSTEVPGLLLCRILGKALCPCGCRGPPDLHFNFSSVGPYK